MSHFGGFVQIDLDQFFISPELAPHEQKEDEAYSDAFISVYSHECFSWTSERPLTLLILKSC